MIKRTFIAVVIVLTLSALCYAGYYDDFDIVSVSFYENLAGDRYAKVTVKNARGGSRLISPDAFTGIRTDGVKIKGGGSETKRVEPNEMADITVYFSRQKWPIEKVIIE